MRDVVRELLTRKDPQGYYVIMYPREATAIIEGIIAGGKGVILEEYGSYVILRIKSRSKARRVILELLRKGLHPV